MINPESLADALRDALRAIPALVTLIGNSGRISAYADDGDTLSEAISTMEANSILVAWIESEPVGANDLGQWVHRLGIFLRVPGNLGVLFATICNAVMADGLRFTETEIHPSFEQLGVPQFTRGQDDEGMEYPRIEMRFRQKGEE